MSDHPEPVAPRDISADEHQQRAEEAFRLDQDIKADLRTGRATLWAVAEKLYQFDELAGWSALGYDRLVDWLADPEVSMRTTTYYTAVARWRKLTVLRSVDFSRLKNLDPSKVDVVLPSIEKQSVKLEDALADVEELGQRDLREKYIGRREKPEPEPEPPVVDADVVEDEDEDEPSGQSDEPSWISVNEVPYDEPAEPAHNEDHEPSGQLPPEPGEERPPLLLGGGLAILVSSAEEALARPDRQAVDRRAIRQSLRDLIAAVKAIDGWDRA